MANELAHVLHDDGELPTDTIIDRDPVVLSGKLSADAIALMKTGYLAIPALRACALHYGWTATQLIDAAEDLRRRGLLTMVCNEASDTLTAKLDEPATKRFLRSGDRNGGKSRQG